MSVMTSARITTLAMLPLISMIWVLQLFHDKVKFEHVDPRAPVHKFVLPPAVVEKLAFGFNGVLADYYFLTAVQSFLKWNGADSYYPEYFHIISRLDPRFEFPYLFGILTVPNTRNPNSVYWLGQLADQGISVFPMSWRIPFMTAMQYHIVKKDYQLALHYLSIADQTPEAPEIVKRTHAIYLMKGATDYEKSRALFVTLLETTNDAETKRIVTERLTLLDLIEVLGVQIRKYKEEKGEYPKNVSGLIPNSATPEIRAILEKYNPEIDQATGNILLR